MHPGNERAIQAVLDYMAALELLGRWYGYSLKRLSYSESAALELLKWLEKAKEEAPLEIIGAYTALMDMYADDSSGEARYIFNTARDVGEEIMENLLS